MILQRSTGMTDALPERTRSPRLKLETLPCDSCGVLGLMNVDILTKVETDPQIKTGNPDLANGDAPGHGNDGD
jgi:hypothetical protein